MKELEESVLTTLGRIVATKTVLRARMEELQDMLTKASRDAKSMTDCWNEGVREASRDEKPDLATDYWNEGVREVRTARGFKELDACRAAAHELNRAARALAEVCEWSAMCRTAEETLSHKEDGNE